MPGERFETQPGPYRESVAFVYVKGADGRLQENGTGFFVCVPGNLPEAVFVYFVTAKHVLIGSDGNLVTEFSIRLNRRGGSEFVDWQSALLGDRDIIWTHPDPSVDIAVVSVNLDMREYDHMPIISTMFLTKEKITERSIDSGDEIFFAGMFMPFTGENRNYPILRFGRIAMMPSEKVPWKAFSGLRETIEVFLVEVQSFGGNSGAPVFIRRGPVRLRGSEMLVGEELLLAGVLKGSILELQDVKSRNQDAGPAQEAGKGEQLTESSLPPTLYLERNVGISAVVPAYFLNEILFSRALIEMRERAGTTTFESLSTSNGSTADSDVS